LCATQNYFWWFLHVPLRHLDPSLALDSYLKYVYYRIIRSINFENSPWFISSLFYFLYKKIVIL
jgi:hypothetical protein